MPTSLRPIPVYAGESRFVGAAREYAADPIVLLRKLLAQYPDLVQVNLGRRQLVICHNADFIQHMLVTHQKNYVHPRAFVRVYTQARGVSLFTSEGEYWRQQRRLLQPAFHREQIARMDSIFSSEVERTLEKWALASGPFDAQADIKMITLNTVGRALFGKRLDDGDGRIFRQAPDDLVAWATRRLTTLMPLPPSLPTPANRKFQRDQAHVHRTLTQLIHERRAQAPDAHHDLLQSLINVCYEDTGEGMTDAQIISEAIGLFFAGHETTADTLAWTLYLLSRHPEIQARVQAEVDSVLNGRTPATGDLPHMPYVFQVIQEAMRLYPAAWAISREPLAADALGEYAVRAGQIIYVAIYNVHHHPRYWPEPECFNPERFSPHGQAQWPHKHG
ncbi:MAG: cytochrome P450, partial [Anaerolineales bacterium]